MNTPARRCLTDSSRLWPNWTHTAIGFVPRSVLSFSVDDVRKTFTTEAAPTSEPAIDANVLVAQQAAQERPQHAEQERPQQAAPPPSNAVTRYAGPPMSLSPRMAAFTRANTRRVSQIVMLLQTKMHQLLSIGEYRQAVQCFETFVNEGFKEAKEMSLLAGQLPINKRPAEFQWLQYIEALSRSERVAVNQISNALSLMRQVHIAPKNYHYSPLLENIRRKGDVNNALRVIEEMNSYGISPSAICYEHAVFTCLMARDLDSTTMLLDSMFRSTSNQRARAYGRWFIYTRVIIFCATLKRIENAITFLRQMSDLKLLVPIHLYLDIALHAAEVDDAAAADTMLAEIQNTRRMFRLRDGTTVLTPLPVEEGVLLSVLNCAARTGDTFLADRAWTMLNDSLKVPYYQARARPSRGNRPGRPRLKPKAIKTSSDTSVEATATEESVVEKDETDDELKEEDKIITAEDAEDDETKDADDSEELLTGRAKEQEEEHQAEEGDFVIGVESSEDGWKEPLRLYLRDERPMPESYHAFIEAQAKAGNTDLAFETVLELEATHPDNPADISPSQGLRTLTDEIAKDVNSVDQAYLVLDRWHREGKKISVVLLDVIVNACARMGDANRAFETFEMYSKLGLSHRTESYNALMEVCATQRQVEVIMKLLQNMATDGVKPNVDTYMQIIEGYINNADTNGMAHALTITRREGFTPTSSVLERAMECANKNNDDRARALVRRELMAAGHLSDLTFGRGRGRGPGFRGRGPGRGYFVGRQSPYAQGNDPRYARQPQGRGERRPPIQTYVGAQPPPALEQAQPNPGVANSPVAAATQIHAAQARASETQTETVVGTSAPPVSNSSADTTPAAQRSESMTDHAANTAAKVSE